MNPKLISFTGADDLVNISDLQKISDMNPDVEWAVLFSKNREGTSRYPSMSWRHAFYDKAPNVNRAAHLCGKEYLQKFASGDLELMTELMNYNRVQLNFNTKHIKPDLLSNLIIKTITQYYKNSKKQPLTIITQYNEPNKDIHLLFKAENHAVLFDASGGNGVDTNTWPSYIEGIQCGYAGGLSPENISEKLKSIKLSAKENNYWIDMESGIRTNNTLDLEKIKSVLDLVTLQSESNTMSIY